MEEGRGGEGGRLFLFVKRAFFARVSIAVEFGRFAGMKIQAQVSWNWIRTGGGAGVEVEFPGVETCKFQVEGRSGGVISSLSELWDLKLR